MQHDDQLIRQRAYQIWEDRGRPVGRALEHWLIAEHEMHLHRATKVRTAGRREMHNPPPDWDIVDEQSDESFPASDPPGNY